MGIDNYDRQILRLPPAGRTHQQPGPGRPHRSITAVAAACAGCGRWRTRRNQGLSRTGRRQGAGLHADGALIYISMDKHTPDRFEHFEKEISQFEVLNAC